MALASKTNDLDGISSALRPRFRLFCSVDLVGSTAYKQLLNTKGRPDEDVRAGVRSAEWFDVFLRFYSTFESTLRATAAEYGKIASTKQRPELPSIEFWKSNGDELLFSFEIDSPDQLSAIFDIWIRAVQAYRHGLIRDTPDLDVKSAAWTAGFPVMNTEVVFHSKPATDLAITPLNHQHRLRNLWYDEGGAEKGYTRDFIGPSIDTGFRIAAKSTPRKLMISAELCYLLLAAGELHDDIERREVYFEPSQPLKGVIGGRPYPNLWTPVDGNSRQIAEEELLGLKPPDRNKLREFCKAFIKDCNRYMLVPFMYDAEGSAWGEVPPDYIDHLRQLEQRLASEEMKETNFSRSADEVGEGRVPDENIIASFMANVGSKAKSGTPPAPPKPNPED